MLKQLTDIWRNNHGSILFASGCVVAIVMSIAWRLDLIPDIRPTLRTSPTLMGGTRSKVVPNIVVVSVTSDEPLDGEVTFQVFTPPDTPNEPLVPFTSRTHRMERGVSEFVVTDLARGTYAAMAFIDINSNLQLDLADDGAPAEPFAFAKVSHRSDETLANGVFNVALEPVFVKFHLKAPASPVTPRPEPTQGTEEKGASTSSRPNVKS